MASSSANDNVTIEGNQIHDIGVRARGEWLREPVYYQNNDHGIYVDGHFTSANNLTIKNNVFYRNERGWSIQIYPAAVNNLRILNNTFLCANPYRDGTLHFAPLTNSAIENNISWQPTTGLPAIHHYLGILKPECGQQSDVPRDGGCGVYAWGDRSRGESGQYRPETGDGAELHGGRGVRSRCPFAVRQPGPRYGADAS